MRFSCLLLAVACGLTLAAHAQTVPAAAPAAVPAAVPAARH